MFVPAIWLFAIYVSQSIAAGLGLLFILGRALYSRGYVAEPSQRTLGFMITFAAQVILTLGALIGAFIRWFA